jgi:hypothetical protein
MLKPNLPCLFLLAVGMLWVSPGAAGEPQRSNPVNPAQVGTLAKGHSPSWTELWGKRPPVKAPPRGSRGNLCAIAPVPVNQTALVWNQTPMLLWQGTVGRVEIHWQQQNQRWRQQVLGQQPLPGQMDWVVYQGAPLQPGQGYYWLIFDAQSRPIARLPFQVVAAEREAIAADLRQLELRLKRQKASLEEIAQRRAHYFADRQLWADVLQEALSVPNPSPALNQFLQAIPEQFCQARRTP